MWNDPCHSYGHSQDTKHLMIRELNWRDEVKHLSETDDSQGDSVLRVFDGIATAGIMVLVVGSFYSSCLLRVLWDDLAARFRSIGICHDNVTLCPATSDHILRRWAKSASI